MTTVLYDLNVILDVLLAREPFYGASVSALDLAGTGKVKGYIAGHLVTTLFYLLRRRVSSTRARSLTAELLVELCVAPVTDAGVRRALVLPFRDLEDAVCHAAADEVGATLIVTRNTKDFETGTIPGVIPEIFLQRMEKAGVAG